MRIAYFGSSSASDGGSELQLLAMARAVSKHHEAILILPDRGPLYDQALASGLETISLGFMRLRRYHGLDWLRYARSTAHARVHLVELLSSRRIELVHFNDFIDFPFYTTAKKAGVKAVSHLRLIAENRLLCAAYRRSAGKTLSMIFPVSKAVQQGMLEPYGLPSRVIHDPRPPQEAFYPRGVELSPESIALRHEWGWKADDMVFVMVSKLLENKGHLNFIRLAEHLQDMPGLSPRFLMIASQSPGREAYRERVLAASRNLAPGSFQWIPGLPHCEVGKYLRCADYFAHLPDTEDSFPGVVLEAMACGLPVIAWPSGGISEQIDEGKAGILIEKKGWQSACGRILEVARDASRKRALTDRALHRLDAEYSQAAFLESLLGAYKKLAC